MLQPAQNLLLEAYIAKQKMKLQRAYWMIGDPTVDMVPVLHLDKDPGQRDLIDPLSVDEFASSEESLFQSSRI